MTARRTEGQARRKDKNALKFTDGHAASHRQTDGHTENAEPKKNFETGQQRRKATQEEGEEKQIKSNRSRPDQMIVVCDPRPVGESPPAKLNFV